MCTFYSSATLAEQLLNKRPISVSMNSLAARRLLARISRHVCTFA